MTHTKQTDPTDTDTAKSNAKAVFLISCLIALPLTIFMLFFMNGTFYTLSGHGLIALAIAIVFSFLSAFFFMGMSFFSSRSGVDDQPNYVELAEKNLARKKTNGV